MVIATGATVTVTARENEKGTQTGMLTVVTATVTVTVTVIETETGTVREMTSPGRDTMMMTVTTIHVPNAGSKHFIFDGWKCLDGGYL
jgi:hypothetical protein